MGLGKTGLLMVPVLLLGLRGQAAEEDYSLKVVEAWDEHSISRRYESEETIYSRLFSYMSYEGPFGFVSTAVYRAWDGVDVKKVKQLSRKCASLFGDDIYGAIECALEVADNHIREIEKVNGMCRQGAEVIRIAINGLGYWQVRAWNRNLSLKDFQHVVSAIRIQTNEGQFEYALDPINWGSELFPLNTEAINYHIQFSELPEPILGQKPIRIPNAL